MRFILLAFILPPVCCFAQTNNSISTEYFYLDAQCQSCILSQGDKTEDHYLISDSFSKGILHDANIERHVNRFKSQIFKEFNAPDAIINNVVLRRLDEESAIRKSREINISKHNRRGYAVGQLPLLTDPPIHDSLIHSYLQLTENFGFAGSVIVAEAGKIIHEGSYGWAIPKYHLLNSTDVAFNLGSIAKSFTAQAILLLIEEDQLTLTSNLEDIFGTVGDDKRKISIQQLLTHTAGFRRDIIHLDEDISDTNIARKKLLQYPIALEPGKKYNYSNAGYQLLGLIVEEVSGLPIDEYLTKKILIPNKIDEVGFFHDLPKNTMAAASMTEWRTDEFPGLTERQYSNLSSTGMVASAKGLFGWFTALQNNQTLFDRMSQAQVGDDVGFGFFISDNGDKISTTGDHGNYHSLLSHDKQKDLTIIVLSNTSLHNFGVHRHLIAKEIVEILEVSEKSYLKSQRVHEKQRIAGSYSAGDFNISLVPLNQQFKLLLRSQAAINYFTKVDSVQLNFVESQEPLLNSVAKSLETETFNRLEDSLGSFYSKILREDHAYYSKEYGALRDVQVVGTIPMPWRSPNYQSLMVMTYGDKVIDLRIVWDGDNIFETLIETGHPGGFILSLAKNKEDQWITYDFITGVKNELFFDLQQNGTELHLPAIYDGDQKRFDDLHLRRTPVKNEPSFTN